MITVSGACLTLISIVEFAVWVCAIGISLDFKIFCATQTYTPLSSGFTLFIISWAPSCTKLIHN